MVNTKWASTKLLENIHPSSYVVNIIKFYIIIN